MITRQRALLELVKQAKRPVQRIELTKWSFLLRHESNSKGGSAFFDFLPYNYGPFSFGLYQEAAKLVSLGYLSEVGDTWAIGKVSAPELNDRASKIDIASILKKFGNMSIESLMDYVYERYPAYTIHSKRKKLARKKIAPVAVYTCGYESLSVDAFLNRLIDNGIEQLIDVRMNPVARRYGYHKSTLSRLCGNVSINYVHLPELGIRSELRKELEDQADYDRLFSRYRKTTLENQVKAIESVCELMQERPSVLVCMERKAACCHRSHLAERVAAGTKLKVIHLGQEFCETS